VCAAGEWDRFGICDITGVQQIPIDALEAVFAERFEAWDEIEDRPRYNIAADPAGCDGAAKMGKKTRKFTTMRWGTDSFLGKRHEHRDSNAQCSIGDSHNNTSISKFDLDQALPYPRGRILRVAEMGSVKQPYCFEVGEGDLFALAGLWDQWKSPEGRSLRVAPILTRRPICRRGYAQPYARHCAAGQVRRVA